MVVTPNERLARRQRRLRLLGRVLAAVAWLALIAEWVTIAIPSAHKPGPDSLIGTTPPAWAQELMFLTLPLTVLFGGFGLAVTLGVRDRRGALAAGGELLGFAITFLLAVVFTR